MQATRLLFSTTGRRALGRTATALRPAASTLSSSSLTASQEHALTVLSNNAGHRYFSNYSSFSEPNPSLFASQLADATVDGDTASIKDPKSADDHQVLRNDIRVMGSLLGKVVREHEGEHIFQTVEKLRGLAKVWREAGAGRGDDKEKADAAFAELASAVENLTDVELYTVSRAFTHFLALANAAEAHHRIRRLRRTQNESTENFGALYPKADSCGGAIPNLLEQGHSPEEIFEALSTQTTELVLTAHPTEVNRRTILAKNRRIQEILTLSDNYRATGNTPFAQEELGRKLYSEVASIWLSDEVARTKPTPETEAEKGTLVIETVLWDAVPQYLRKLDATSKTFLGKGLPLESAPIKFASWMGGDRDGNPNVKPNTTRIVCLRNRAKAASLFKRDLLTLQNELSITTCSDEIKAVVGDAREPYRAFIKPMVEKLERTQMWAEQELARVQEGKSAAETTISTDEIYISKKELMSEFETIYRSLEELHDGFAAEGKLTDMMRNLSAFGLTLIPLDVRQESDKHEEAVDSITRYLGLGSYSQWDEQTKLNWLTTQIASKRPLIRPGVWHENPEYFSPTAVDTLEIFQMIAEQHEDSLGAYVISQATSASDVLNVLLLQLDAGVKKPLRVAPLFETLGDLEGATDTMKTLFSLPAYMGIINGKQEVMIGYSDSAKDAGRLAASNAQIDTQSKLAKLAKEHSVDMTFFHGKGGTVGRGGNPQTFLAIMSHAPDTINGHFRVTEQGEMINQNFGFSDRAERTMDIYTAAVLSEKISKRQEPAESWKNVMSKISDVSCDSYRSVVRGDERFVPYFRSATPELELSNLNIGSRPAKRKATGGVESLRAIPWNFAWTQTRSNLPSWLGVGDALSEVLESEDSATLHDMYENWGSFRAMIDVVEMVLAKSEPAIAEHYESVLVKDELAKKLGAEVRKKHLEAENAVLELTGHSVLAENNNILVRQMGVRNRYVDCLNVLQVETLKRLREGDENDKTLKDALLISITGVANGMGNTG
eukprot:CAMPEP_0172453300 /NCGR_PEP_ID=MMETSP1065-20121228/10686_1 /TAXON_ID=265537 /ORGANISM="Amphiprora paludosa, Strain CCMP125" /LENGTH=1005 /DNA_ID=CAMNT_0013205479 /DNA_START=39 /DNA_END=3056 /DNA_ORIENTATION=+